MAAATSPKFKAVGETPNPINYVALVTNNQTIKPLTKTVLKPIQVRHGEPIIQFTFKELDDFAIEEGLHQAVLMKLSYGAPDFKDLKTTLLQKLGVKGKCLVGLRAHHHLLLRFDLYEDFVAVLSKQVGYFQFNGKQHQFITFPWSQWFDPKEETSKALVWISFPGLPTNLFAKKALLSIDSVLGKPIAVDKVTQERTRPSTTKVKVILDLLDKHPKRTKLNYLDEATGKIIEHYQECVIDNAPAYCTFCKHQGHEDINCHLITRNSNSNTQKYNEVAREDDADRFRGDLR